MESSEIIMYESEDGKTKLEVQLDGETVWLTQAQIAELFGVQTPGISKHLKNIFEEGELDESMVVSKMEMTTQHGAISGKTQTKSVKTYNLDAVISVGYRVNSKRATHFRRWATGVLRDYIVKGFALDDDRLKRGDSSYWKELLDRIRDIRSSEKMLYRQVLDLYARHAAAGGATRALTRVPTQLGQSPRRSLSQARALFLMNGMLFHNKALTRPDSNTVMCPRLIVLSRTGRCSS